MKITYVQFRDAVHVGGNFNSIPSWSAEKHEAKIPISMEGGFVVLSPDDNLERAVPMTNVVYIIREAKTKPDPKRAA